MGCKKAMGQSRADQLWEMLDIPAREVATGGVEQARDHLHLRQMIDQHMPEVEVQVKC